MIGRAKALKETSTELRGRLRYAVYDDAIRRQLFREKRLKNIMGAALQNREFQVYLQPKYRTESETIGGAEALVRWMGAEGIIYPDGSSRCSKRTDSSSAGPLGVRRVLPPHPGVARRRLPPVKVPMNCSRVQLKSPFPGAPYRNLPEVRHAAAIH